MVNWKRIVFWSIGFSPTLLMLALLMYVAIKEAFLSPAPCISKGCAFEESILMMDLLLVLIMTWVAHAIQGVVISVIGENNGRMWIASIAGMDYSNVKNILSLWVLFYPFAMWVLMRVVFYLTLSDKGPDVPRSAWQAIFSCVFIHVFAS